MAKPTKTREVIIHNISPVDPRVRMKEIRTEVASFLQGYNPKGLSHLGDLPQDMPDARRAIIAVQNLLDIEMKKHKKATEHVASLIHVREESIEYIEHLHDVVHKQTLQIGKLTQLLERSNDTSVVLHKALQKSEQQRDSFLTTLKLMNRVQNG
jgi:hypothetical protein